MNTQEEQKNTESIFSEKCYEASNRLATTVGHLLTAIQKNEEINWWSAQEDCLQAKLHAMLLGGLGTDGTKSSIAGFLLLHPLVNSQTKDWNDWTEFFQKLRKIFPAWNSQVIQGENPEFSKEDAETMAALDFDRALMESVFPQRF
jgi:hypothetical protein